MSDLYDRLNAAVVLESDDAAIRIHAEYAPQAGPAAKVFPPTYLLSDGTKYHFEQRWGPDDEPIPIVVLDSYQSQANRVEAALKEVAEVAGLPQFVVEADLKDRTIRVSSLDAPHRSRDAYLLDSELEGVAFDKTEVGQALNLVTVEDATTALRFAPYDLVYGVWDSHRGKRVPTKFARSYTSEMIGWHAIAGKRGATKGDPLNLPGKTGVSLSDWRPETQAEQKKKTELALNKVGHGMIPSSADSQAGGVSVRSITREAVLSLTGLARFGFPTADTDATGPGRTALAALGLLGDRLAFSNAGLHLRSGSDLVLVSENIEWVRRGGETERFELSVPEARELLTLAAERLSEAGVPWSGEPVMLRPSTRLREIIEQTFYVPTLDAEA